MNNKLQSLVFIIVFVFAKAILAEAYFDLSQNNIKIETDFNGKEIIIFGILNDDQETIITIKGPPKKALIQKKERILGFWFNTKQITYDKVPSIFFIASSAPINIILDENIIRKRGLNFKNFDNHNFNINNSNNTKIYEDSLYQWDQNLIRKQKFNNFYNE